MKMEIDAVVSPDAAGPARADALIVPAQKTGSDVIPPAVVLLARGDGRTVQLVLSTAEARMLGEVLITCGCYAEGGPPPTMKPAAAAPPIIINGGRA